MTEINSTFVFRISSSRGTAAQPPYTRLADSSQRLQPDAIGASFSPRRSAQPQLPNPMERAIYTSKRAPLPSGGVSTEIYPQLPTKRPVRVSKIIIKLCLTSADVSSGIIGKVDNLSSRRCVNNDVALGPDGSVRLGVKNHDPVKALFRTARNALCEI